MLQFEIEILCDKKEIECQPERSPPKVDDFNVVDRGRTAVWWTWQFAIQTNKPTTTTATTKTSQSLCGTHTQVWIFNSTDSTDNGRNWKWFIKAAKQLQFHFSLTFTGKKTKSLKLFVHFTIKTSPSVSNWNVGEKKTTNSGPRSKGGDQKKNLKHTFCEKGLSISSQSWSGDRIFSINHFFFFSLDSARIIKTGRFVTGWRSTSSIQDCVTSTHTHTIESINPFAEM